MSSFHKRWKFMNLIKKEDEYFTTFASTVNDQCEGFKLVELSPDSFKCLIFVQGLASTKYPEIRRVLNKLGNEPNLPLQNIADLLEVYKCSKKMLTISK